MVSRTMSYRPDNYGTLKHACAELIDQVGGVQRASDLCRLSASSISDCINEHKDRAMPLDVVFVLERFSHNSPVTQYMATTGLHWDLCPRNPADINVCAKMVLREVADVIHGIGSDRATPELLREIDEAVNVLQAFRSKVSDDTVKTK